MLLSDGPSLNPTRKGNGVLFFSLSTQQDCRPVDSGAAAGAGAGGAAHCALHSQLTSCLFNCFLLLSIRGSPKMQIKKCCCCCCCRERFMGGIISTYLSAVQEEDVIVFAVPISRQCCCCCCSCCSCCLLLLQGKDFCYGDVPKCCAKEFGGRCERSHQLIPSTDYTN